MKRFISVLALTVFCGAVAPAHATPAPPTLTGTPCPTGASLFANANVLACSGFWGGNLLNRGAGQAPDSDEETPLLLLGWTPQNVIQKISPLADPSQYINFTAPLFGTTWLAIHWGGGNTNIPQGGATAFFKIDVGNVLGGLDKLELTAAYRHSTSNTTLYQTGVYDPTGGPNEGVVPEPATMTLLATGLAGMAAARRRRKNA